MRGKAGQIYIISLQKREYLSEKISVTLLSIRPHPGLFIYRHRQDYRQHVVKTASAHNAWRNVIFQDWFGLN